MPREVVKLMTRLVGPWPGMRVYDPCVGSGGMLLESYHYVMENGGAGQDLALYSQDNNGSA